MAGRQAVARRLKCDSKRRFAQIPAETGDQGNRVPRRNTTHGPANN
jgi:hypothetical protein